MVASGLRRFRQKIDEAEVQLIGIRAASESIETDQQAASLTGSSPGFCDINRTYLLQDNLRPDS